MKILGWTVGTALALFAAITLLALEGGEVVVLRTTGGGGQRHETRAWIADSNGIPWIEAANPDRDFYRDVLAGSEIEIERNGAAASYRAEPMPNPQGHLTIRRLLRDKYGWADAWIGLVADTSGSIGIRLHHSP